jgi:2-polyprenyl-3-methyl-5-hydroxy-6-metoxy-1,4-benzoquinol methylase
MVLDSRPLFRICRHTRGKAAEANGSHRARLLDRSLIGVELRRSWLNLQRLALPGCFVFLVARRMRSCSVAQARMIIHKLIRQHLQHRDDEEFYLLQARDAIVWMQRYGVRFGPGVTALDLGCGHGVLGAELIKLGCAVTFADESNYLFPSIASAPFRQINLDRDDPAKLGTYDVVICSNVLEHLAKPFEFIGRMSPMLRPEGRFYLSWTNWLSPWGGHDFSPFHYLGPQTGHRVFDRIVKRKRIHTPYVTLYPTYIGQVLRVMRRRPDLKIVKVAPRYYPEFSWLMGLPVVREFLAWNCAVLLAKR